MQQKYPEKFSLSVRLQRSLGSISVKGSNSNIGALLQVTIYVDGEKPALTCNGQDYQGYRLHQHHYDKE